MHILEVSSNIFLFELNYHKLLLYLTFDLIINGFGRKKRQKESFVWAKNGSIVYESSVCTCFLLTWSKNLMKIGS